MLKQHVIKDLAVISDRRSCALMDKEGTICWYCPNRFDAEAVMSSLLDLEKGGYWTINAEGKNFLQRQYQDRSSVLKTHYAINGKGFTLTDFMPLNTKVSGICRSFSKAPCDVESNLRIAPNYGSKKAAYQKIRHNVIRISDIGLYLHCSHPLNIQDDMISFIIPRGESGWAYLGSAEIFAGEELPAYLEDTLKHWEEVEALVNYHGPYENEVRYSLRALQQMVYEPTGGIIAAATTSLPEVIGGARNYDYRYVWMRDAALITSSLTQIITTGELEEKFINFISGAMEKNEEDHISCFYSIDQQKLTAETIILPLKGYFDSQPVQIGNSAATQYQLDAEANVLIACGLIYKKFNQVTHWDTVSKIADFICKNWQRKDNGIWEEEQVQHYTSSKAFAARGLELIAPYQTDPVKAAEWLRNAALIRTFIEEHCKTADGAYAVHAGSEDVDVTAALFAPFGIYEAKSVAMVATITRIERDYCERNLYRRHLLEFDSSKEGAFLAGSCWIAHHYALAGNLEKSKQILDAVLGFSNDLGFFAEEADLNTTQLLGNFPQTFVHSSFICAANGYKQALSGFKSMV
ncbi:glycoside hydrolase family 15 protein [Pedobacter frigidisoli]|uniref:glycoside hydrolase family 15 protein n=1 Tax=Pedobacter frigidisoli TaxID=2530455 RepID=UPI00292F6C63|nr:glycoside hydrolase family 15 protein [Pedobacter frigidisoli]